MNNVFNSDYWNQLYATHHTRWDIGAVSPPLKAYIDQLTNKNAAILIPGCGNAYEAAYLLQQGFTNVTLVDLVPELTARLQQQLAAYGDAVHIITGDFFALQQHFDLVLEQTFFCALDPSLRSAYVQQMHRLLTGGGKLAGVLFNRTFTGNVPPFGGSREEYEQLFSELFHIRTMDMCYNSIKPRAERELFVIMEAKD
ncbi:methyltransferase domain-containing protein [Deminuibacter soli]|uniref:Methyltransferase domain-containing protein n=1 Tax=Deminuibacter soli TaxID=2291815 RepID=A0A3E1NJ84_9BACT|nr:methyltransferase domain-containing protein [Deminuibacter soli]RFM27995.1 methyltransferase domain-containing protein [Deminuibacter soli]